MEEQQKIKVLHVVNNLGVGGIEKLVFDLVSHIPSARYELEICCVRAKEGAWLGPIEELGIPVHFLGNYRTSPSRFFRAYKRLLTSGKYQAVHVHLNHFSGFFLCHPARLSVPVRISHYHNDFTPHNRLLRKRLLMYFGRMVTDRYATVNIGISEACLDSVYGQQWRKRTDVSRIYNGVDLEKFSFSEQDRALKRAEFGIDPESIVIGHVGRFRPQKNHAFIVELAIDLCCRKENVVFFLVGDGVLLSDIRSSVEKKGLEGNFIFAGARTDVPELMSLMDIFIFPSLWEGFGLTVIEAQASGLPVVASENLPKEIPLINNSKQILLDDIAAWIGACELLIESKGAGEERLAFVPDGLEFSLADWISKISFLYEKKE